LWFFNFRFAKASVRRSVDRFVLEIRPIVQSRILESRKQVFFVGLFYNFKKQRHLSNFRWLGHRTVGRSVLHSRYVLSSEQILKNVCCKLNYFLKKIAKIFTCVRYFYFAVECKARHKESAAVILVHSHRQIKFAAGVFVCRQD